MTFNRAHWPSLVMTAIVVLAYAWSGGSWIMALGAGVALLLAPWIRWRYRPGKRLGDWLYFIVAIPFVVLALADGGDKGDGSFLTSNRFTQLSNAYLLCLAMQESYREKPFRQGLVVHLALLGVLFHAGLSYDIKAYPLFVSLYAAALVWWLRETTLSSSVPGWSRRLGPVLGSGAALLMASVVAGGLFVYLRQAEFQMMDVYRKMMSGGGPTLMGPVRESELGSLPAMFASTGIIARWFGPNPQYLRSHVLVGYEHNRWTPAADDKIASTRSIVLETDPVDSPLNPSATGPVFHFPGPPPSAPSTTASVLEDGFGTILAPYGTWAVSTGGSGGGVKSDPFGILRSTGGVSAFEAHLAWTDRATQDLTDRPVDDPAYLAVPAALRGEVTRLAREIVGTHGSAGVQAAAIKAWLQSHCTYNLQPAAEAGKDRIETFLFGNHQGYCEYFATGMALLLRTQGVRCRYVLGYMVREKNRIGGYWIIRARDAHAWLEVYIPGRGWTLWDPTPAAELEAMAGFDPPWITQIMDQYGLWFARFWASVQSGNWKQFLRQMLGYLRILLLEGGAHGWPWLTVGALAYLAYGQWTGRGRGGARAGPTRRPERDPMVMGLAQCLARAERRLSRLGKARRLHETWVEFARRAQDEALNEIVAVYCRCRYAGEPWTLELEARLKHLK